MLWENVSLTLRDISDYERPKDSKVFWFDKRRSCVNK